MYQRITVRTLFDITQTNTTGRFRPDQTPYLDAVGNEIQDLADWNQSRNRQRNLETVIQTLTLRSQISDVTTPVKHNSMWSFDFTVDTPSAYGDQLEILLGDLEGVPMIAIPPTVVNTHLIATGVDTNIWVEIIR